jgi:hypothetical protein
MISRYSDLYPLLQPDLPGIPTPLLLQTLQAAGREFCRTTESWRERLTMNIVDPDTAYDTAYDAAIALGQSATVADIAGDTAYDAALVYQLKPSYDAEVIRCDAIWTNGDDTEAQLDQSVTSFDPGLMQLTFQSPPKVYSPTATTWATLTAYTTSSIVLVSGARYQCAIAHTAGTWATDLAANRWKLLPNELLIDVILVPRLLTCELAAWFMEKWSEAIIAKTMALLVVMRNKPWSSPERLQYLLAEYRRCVNLSLRENLVRDTQGSMRMIPPTWTP